MGNPEAGSNQDLDAQFIAAKLIEHSSDQPGLALVHMRNFARVLYHLSREESHNRTFPAPPSYRIDTEIINPDHLYFALGQLPFVTGKIEKERQDPFAQPAEIIDSIKDLFRETRDDYFEDEDEIAQLSPARIGIALTFLRNLTVQSGDFLPLLLDIVDAAKGVGGNAYAVRILKSAKYYPYIPIDRDRPFMSVGINRVTLPAGGGVHDAVNLFRDRAFEWRTISLKPDPTPLRKMKYRFTWNPLGMCSHIPEDRRVESFNSYLRNKAQRVLVEDLVKTEKFTSSVKDGIDIRETLRNWHTQKIYVKEVPPSRGKLDTVIIIFDSGHDDKYPHCATWYAEHENESTLSFFATDPFENMIGPGIARSYYGGLSLRFPPKSIPNVFELTQDMDLRNLAERLTYGALLFSGECNVAFVAARKPDVRLRTIATALKKHLIWIPISSFSTETIRTLRRFHVLNGKLVRSWASHFIGD
jgi:hypothetical protein